MTHTVSSLKSFNEDLITLEVFAYGHNQVEKGSGQLLLDTANRLPASLKRRYLDELDKSLLDLINLVLRASSCCVNLLRTKLS